ncbi:MAG: hypothetical protein C0505_17525 [Leptothrix sp. (in: Bacteria)]|nr:hypothetical protein [Leptothrix sp. (in: b-proteobacteria)]
MATGSPAIAAAPLQAIAGFAALLREHGLQVGVAEQQDFVSAALALPLQRSAPCQVGDTATGISAAWRAIACHDSRSWRQWPDLFERYWYPQRLKGTVRVSGQTRPARDLRQVVQTLQDQLAGDNAPKTGARAMDTALQAAAPALQPEAEAAPRAQGGASRTEALHDRRLNEWLPQDLAQLERLAEVIARRLRERLTRRWRDHPRGARLDVRRTLRASLKTGGVPMQPAWRRPRREKPRVFILVDVSRSMETHAQLFLRIARAFVQALGARVFVFHTRLAEVTPLLQRRVESRASVQEKVNAVTAGFGGGTRIATSLHDFHAVHARAQLGRAARVWVLSDGFDADEPQRLAQELAAVRSRGARITWFHPAEHRPASAAMQAALPLVTRFVRLNRLRDLALAADVLN